MIFEVSSLEKTRPTAMAFWTQPDLWIPALQLPLRGVLHHVRLHFLSHGWDLWSKMLKTQRPDLWQKKPPHISMFEANARRKKHEKSDTSTKSTVTILPDPNVTRCSASNPELFGEVKSPRLLKQIWPISPCLLQGVGKLDPGTTYFRPI